MTVLSKPISGILDLAPSTLHLLILGCIYVIYVIANRYFIQPYFSSLRNLSGPRRSKQDGWIPWIGHLRPIIKGEPGVATAEWIGKYGRAFSESSSIVSLCLEELF